ncbi:curli production assembly/transport component CsgF [Desulfocurvibacter africanus]|uniref:curli production assembly/transport component CsgF n=1 Tax=Desulfocurvibacter africanus TaxID=873 RepID=UPI000410C3D0|nr:curli production assembly/transport component CsgF [Desulfocurvibacter africanus]
MRTIFVVSLLCMALAAMPSTASATELVFGFTNPSFGGDPMIGNFLLNKADSQKRFAEDEYEEDPLSDFEDGLNRRVLGLIADKIVQDAFGDEGNLSNGTYTIGSYVISIDNNGKVIKVAVTDSLSGDSTVVEVPVF